VISGAAGFRDLLVELDEPDKGYNCMTLYGEKAFLNLCTDAPSLFTAVTRSCLSFYSSWNAWSGSAPDQAARSSVRRSSAEIRRGLDVGDGGPDRVGRLGDRVLGEAVVAERVRGVQLPLERLQPADRGRHGLSDVVRTLARDGQRDTRAAILSTTRNPS
jgi:hypothetical protein